MNDTSKLTRRERQIMDVLFARGEATVNQIAKNMPDPPTAMAVRRMILKRKMGTAFPRPFGRTMARRRDGGRGAGISSA